MAWLLSTLATRFCALQTRECSRHIAMMTHSVDNPSSEGHSVLTQCILMAAIPSVVLLQSEVPLTLGVALCVRLLIRPHPAVWRLVHGAAIVYLVVLTFTLFQVSSHYSLHS